MTGIVSATLNAQTYGGGLCDVVVLKYDSTGVLHWTQLAGSSGADFGDGGMSLIERVYYI